MKLSREITEKILLAMVKEYLEGVDLGPGWGSEAYDIEETAKDFQMYLADTDWAAVLKEVEETK